MPYLRFILPVLVLVAVVLSGRYFGPALAKEGVDLDAKLPVDPALERVGHLPNGMQYWIRPHDVPKGKVTLMLHISSGALQEEENQRGLAHFLEHMAFNGSKNFPAGEVVKYFESMGMRFGQHQNAFTGFVQTTYILSLPDTKKETLERGLLFFSDVAHELTIAAAEVEKERGVIAEEKRARGGVQMRLMEQLLPMLMPGSRLSERLPIGTEEVIENAPPERLRAYYEKWYRPDISTLLIVGDVVTADVEPLIEKTFGSWKKPETPPEHVATGVKLLEGVQAGVVTDPEQTEGEVSVSLLRKDLPMVTVGDYRRALLESLASRMLNRRLGTRVQEDDATFSGASVQRGQALVDIEMLGFGAVSAPEDWKASLGEVVHEIRRAKEHGFGAAELAQAKQSASARLQQMAQGMRMAPAQALGQMLNQALSRGRMPQSPEQRIQLTAALLPGIKPSDVQQALNGMLTLDNVYVILTVPESEGVKAPTNDELKAVYEQALTGDVEQQVERAALGSILDKAPRPGSIAERTEEKELGVVSLTLGNGVRVHIKSMPDVETVNVHASFFGGAVEEDATTRGLTEAAGVAFAPGRMATQRLKPAQVTEYLSARKVNVGGGVSEIAITLDVSGAAADLDEGMRLAWLLMTEPHVDEASLESWKREQKVDLEQIASSTQVQGMLALRRLASGGDPRFVPPTPEQIDGITCKAAQAWLTRIMLEAPVEVVIAGNIGVAEAEQLAQNWFGALGKRPDRFAEILKLRRVKEVAGPLVETVPVKTVTPMAFVLLGWRGAAHDAPAEQIALTHAASMLSSRLIQSVREERGLTYSVGANYQYTDFEGLDGVGVLFTADPAKAEEAAKVAKETVVAFAKSGPTEAEIAATEAQFANVLGAQMESPRFWVGMLSKTHANGRTVAEMRTRLKMLRTVDVDVLKAVLARVLQDNRYAQVIAKPE